MGVEMAYRTIKNVLQKNVLQIENFTGNSQPLVEQDVYSTMFLKNMVAFARLDADQIVTQNENPDKYVPATNQWKSAYW